MEKAPKARIGDLDKKKYLVPSDLTGKCFYVSKYIFLMMLISNYADCIRRYYNCLTLARSILKKDLPSILFKNKN